jgi:FkbM family methyltransferase
MQNLLNQPVIIKLRSLTRKLGLNTFIVRIFNIFSSNSSNEYEAKFKVALIRAINPRDIVWDIGANVGYYTQLFVENLDEKSKIVSFEPNPASYNFLQKKSIELTRKKSVNIKNFNVALGEKQTVMNFLLEDDPTAPTCRLVENIKEPRKGKIIEVQVRKAESFMENNNLENPSLIKIDVEGYELEVLKGMKHLLESSKCKNIFIEVHFSILEERGKSNAPFTITKMLKESGFRLIWLDISHIHAYKN